MYFHVHALFSFLPPSLHLSPSLPPSLSSHNPTGVCMPSIAVIMTQLKQYFNRKERKKNFSHPHHSPSPLVPLPTPTKLPHFSHSYPNPSLSSILLSTDSRLHSLRNDGKYDVWLICIVHVCVIQPSQLSCLGSSVGKSVL